MSVIIRREGMAYTWTCKVMVNKKGKMAFCNHVDTADSEKAASTAYENHKKTTKGH